MWEFFLSLSLPYKEVRFFMHRVVDEIAIIVKCPNGDLAGLQPAIGMSFAYTCKSFIASISLRPLNASLTFSFSKL